MIPTLQRTYSKAKSIANQVVWTAQQPMPITFSADGLLSCGLYGLYNVTGQPVYCSAYQIDFVVPAQDPGFFAQITLQDGNGIVVPGSLMKVYGCTASQMQNVVPAYLVNGGNSLQFNIKVINGIPIYLPQDVILTYYMNYSNGLAMSGN